MKRRLARLLLIGPLLALVVGCRSAGILGGQIAKFVETNVTGSEATGVASYDDVTRLRKDHDGEFVEVRNEMAAGDAAIRHDVDAQFQAFGDAQAKALAEGKSAIEAIREGVKAQVQESTRTLAASLETTKTIAASGVERATKAEASAQIAHDEADVATNQPTGIVSAIFSGARSFLPPWADPLLSMALLLLTKKHGATVAKKTGKGVMVATKATGRVMFGTGPKV